MASQEEAVEYLSGLLGNDANALEFIHEYSTQRYPKVEMRGSWQPPLKTETELTSNNQTTQWKNAQNVYQKSEAEDYFVGRKKKPATPPRSEQQYAPELQPQSAPLGSSLLSDKLNNTPTSPSTSKAKQKKATKKSRAEAAAALAEIEGMVKVGNAPPGFGGRLVCECLGITLASKWNVPGVNFSLAAAKHGLVTNCLTCGKIICRLEGEGPCPDCGTPVLSKGQQMQIFQDRKRTRTASNTKAPDVDAGQRYRKAAGGNMAAVLGRPNGADEGQFPILEKEQQAWERAEAQKEKLLDFQRNSAARTRVHDISSDFDYNADISNQWLTAEERALATRKAQEQRKAEEEQKRRRVISIDLVNKRVVDATPRNIAKPKKEEVATPRPPSPPADPRSTGQFRNPYLNTPAPQYVPVSLKKDDTRSKSTLQQKKKMAADAEKQKQSNAQREAVKENVVKQQPAVNKNSRERRALRRLQTDYADDIVLSGKGSAIRGPGDFEFDEYGAEGGGGYGDEPECG
ncbi:hypothetical protein HDV00_000132 [Rhizophlyctis rosea]|nr:hypothetical protein HDV00_000132 [Rhizophlyctis rosea]